MPYVDISGIRTGVVVCGKCERNITNKQAYFCCDGCKIAFHPHCKGIHGKHVKTTALEKFFFCSDTCERADLSLSNVSHTSSPSESLPSQSILPEEIDFSEVNLEDTSSFGLYLKKIYDFMKIIHHSQTYISNTMEELKIQNQKVLQENATLKKKLNEATEHGAQFQKKVVELEVELDDMKQDYLNNNIIIAGLPPNLTSSSEIFDNLFKRINCSSHDSIQAISTIENKSQSNPNASSPLYVIHLKSSDVKKKILASKRNHPHIFSEELGLVSDPNKEIFFRQHLTKLKSHLFYHAKKIQIENEYKFIWIKNNVIYIRKNEGSKVYRVRSEADLQFIIQHIST